MCPEAWGGGGRTVFQCAVSFQAARLSCMQVSWMLGISFGSKQNKLIMEKKKSHNKVIITVIKMGTGDKHDNSILCIYVLYKYR